MTIHSQVHDDRVESDLVDDYGEALVRVTLDGFDSSLPIGIGSAVYAPPGPTPPADVEWETNWLTLEQARELLRELERLVRRAAVLPR